jgi:hypothetical protein
MDSGYAIAIVARDDAQAGKYSCDYHPEND